MLQLFKAKLTNLTASRYCNSLYLTSGTSFLVIILYIMSVFYHFPGAQGSLLELKISDITYRIYIFEYCITGGVDDQYAKTGNGCHLDLNPLAVVFSMNKTPLTDPDLIKLFRFFHSLTAASFAIYYLNIHSAILLSYLFWRQFNRLHNDFQINKRHYGKLWGAYFVQMWMYIIPSSMLSWLQDRASKIINNLEDKSISVKVGRGYITFLHFLWVLYCIALFIMGCQYYLKYIRAKKVTEELEKKDYLPPIQLPPIQATGGHFMDDRWAN